MASACVNNISLQPDTFLKDRPSPPTNLSPFGWLNPTRVSYSDDDHHDPPSSMRPSVKESPEHFEFRLDDPVSILPSADELFLDGKLVPLQISSSRTNAPDDTNPPEKSSSDEPSTETCRTTEPANSTMSDPYLFSPKAPRCTVRWRDLLRRKKLVVGGGKADISSSKLSYSTNTAPETATLSTSVTTASTSARSIRHFLNRTSKPSLNLSISSSDPTNLNLPLLKVPSSSTDCCEPVSISSSRYSLSSSSTSSHDHDDIPTRLSLDTTAPTPTDNNNKIISHIHQTIPVHRSTSTVNNNHHVHPHPRMRQVKPRSVPPTTSDNPKPLIDHPSAPVTASRASGVGVSLDSPRMNSSGKVVFQSLERSCSSPSSFNGGPRYKHRGVERSYSANVRITPVLNVPVCSLRGSSSKKSGSGGRVFRFGQLFSSTTSSGSQLNKKESNGNSGSSSRVKSQQQQQQHQLFVVGSVRSRRQST